MKLSPDLVRSMIPDGSGFWFWEAVVYLTPSSPAFLLLLIVSGGVVGEFGPGSSPVPLWPLLLFAFFGLTDSRSENRIVLSSPQLGSCIFALLLILKDVWVSSTGESDSLDRLRLSIFSLLKLWSNGLTHQNRCLAVVIVVASCSGRFPVEADYSLRRRLLVGEGDDVSAWHVSLLHYATYTWECFWDWSLSFLGLSFVWACLDHFVFLSFCPVWVFGCTVPVLFLITIDVKKKILNVRNNQIHIQSLKRFLKRAR